MTVSNDLDVAGRRPDEGLERRLEAEQLLDRERHPLGLAPEQVALVREALEVEQGVRDEPLGRRDAGHEQEHADAEQLVVAQALLALGRDHQAQQVVARRGSALRGGDPDVRMHRVADVDDVRRELDLTGDAGEHRGRRDRSDTGWSSAGKPSQLHTISAGRGRASSRGEVGRAALGEPLDEADGRRADDGLEAFPDQARLERGMEHGPDPLVGGRVDAGQVTGGLEQLGPVVEVVAE